MGGGSCWLCSLAFAVLISQSARELQLPLRAGLGCGGVDLAADHAEVAARQALPAYARASGRHRQKGNGNRGPVAQRRAQVAPMRGGAAWATNPANELMRMA